ncbi:MAG: MBL fold metallo-hydrolase [Alphaproteobacteria bacterium]|nr:MBL fold metallo-hydrolase [Alphaproteobacteria bacterium]
MIFRQLFDNETSTYTYLLGDRASRAAVLVDPVDTQIDRDLQLVAELGLELKASLDTHVHADHVTGASVLKERTGCEIVYPAHSGAIGPDRAVRTGDVLQYGAIRIETRLTPGHTNGSATYVLADHSMAFTGDALLIRGCGRTDFQEGCAETLYDSVHQQIFTLPDDCLLYPGHDYKGRTVTSVAEEKAYNPRLGGGRTKQEFARIMQNLNLAYPKRIDTAVPANLALGRPA